MCRRDKISPKWYHPEQSSENTCDFGEIRKYISPFTIVVYGKNSPVTGWGGLSYMPCVKLSKRCQNVKKISNCQKDVKLSKRCQTVKKMSNVKKSSTQTMEEVHKKKWHKWGSHILTSILMSNMKVTKIVQKHFLCTFWGFLVTIIWDVKIDINMCEPHYANLFFCDPPW